MLFIATVKYSILAKLEAASITMLHTTSLRMHSIQSSSNKEQKHQFGCWRSKRTSSSKKRVGEAATARCLFSLPGVRELTEEARTATGMSALATATLSLLVPCRKQAKAFWHLQERDNIVPPAAEDCHTSLTFAAYLLCTRPLAALLVRNSLYRQTIVGSARAALPHQASSGGLAARTPDAVTSRRRKS